MGLINTQKHIAILARVTSGNRLKTDFTQGLLELPVEVIASLIVRSRVDQAVLQILMETLKQGQMAAG